MGQRFGHFGKPHRAGFRMMCDPATGSNAGPHRSIALRTASKDRPESGGCWSSGLCARCRGDDSDSMEKHGLAVNGICRSTSEKICHWSSERKRMHLVFLYHQQPIYVSTVYNGQPSGTNSYRFAWRFSARIYQ